MFYKKIFAILLFLSLNNCTSVDLKQQKIDLKHDNIFKNKGFALIYDEQLYNNKIISKKIDLRSYIIFQKNLKKNTTVKITNILNKKSLIAKVGSNGTYPIFNNSVVSERIAKELNLSFKEPYIEIISVPKSIMFIAKKAKIYEEEKQVADKAPIKIISIDNINKKKINQDNKKSNNNKFLYNIKIADFYFDKTAISMINRIKNETTIKNVKFKKISINQYRVYLGPFNNIKALQNSFNDISILKFENIEIIKND